MPDMRNREKGPDVESGPFFLSDDDGVYELIPRFTP